MNPFDALLINPILNLLIIFYSAMLAVSIPSALGLAIILLTVVIRMALWPLTTAQLKSTQKMAALKPHLDQLKNQHGHDKVRHQQEITKLYKEHGVNPLAGCLPILLQIPVFFALYNVLLKIVEFGKADFLSEINNRLYSFTPHLDKIPDTSFLGFNLASKPSEWREIGLFIILIPIITGVLQWIQSKMLIPEVKATSVSKANQNKGSMEDTMTQMQSQMTIIMPVMIAFFSYTFPVGLALYWNAFTIIGIIQQYVITGAGAFNKYLPESLKK